MRPERAKTADDLGALVCGRTVSDQLVQFLDRLEINSNLWTELVTRFDSYFGHVVGRAAQVVDRAKQAGRSYYRGRNRCAEAFG